MKITSELLKSFGYTTKYPECKITVYFSKNRESYIAVDGYRIIITVFVNDRPKEIYRGEVENEDELNTLITKNKWIN